MHVEDQIHECAPCKGAKIKVGSKQKTGLLMGVVLAILPKCPFCIVAYSSTMVLCSGKTVDFNPVHASPLTLMITGFIGLITLSCILLNFRDKRTIYAFMLALSGLAMVFFSVANEWSSWLYYGGTALVFMGIWLNASLLNYLNRLSIFIKRASVMN